MRIVIYIPPVGTCDACTKLKKSLKELKVDYIVREIDEEYKKRYEFNRHKGAPHAWLDDKRFLFSGCPGMNTLAKTLPGLMAESNRRKT